MRINHNRGVTLVSLLIGVSLGAFLILVILQIFSATRANFKLAQNLADLDSIMRFAEMSMTDIIQQAGYRTPNSSTGLLPSYTTTFPAFTSALYGPTGSAYTTSGYPNSDDPAGVVLSYYPGENVFISGIESDQYDKLWVKFQGATDGSIRDCNDLYGNATTATKVRFYSRAASVAGGNAQTAYYCERQDNNVNYVYSDQPTGTVLIPAEVYDSVMVRYGEDLTGKGYIDRWETGNFISNRNRVYAVRVAILAHTKDDVRSNAVTQTFWVFNQSISRTSKKIYRLRTFTILLPYQQNYPFGTAIVTP